MRERRNDVCGHVAPDGAGGPHGIESLDVDPRHDMRDAEERAAITAALEQLPADHPARVAYLDHADTIALTYLVADRPGLVDALKEAYLKGFGRLMRSAGHFRP
jgi:hypothetical protein